MPLIPITEERVGKRLRFLGWGEGAQVTEPALNPISGGMAWWSLFTVPEKVG